MVTSFKTFNIVVKKESPKMVTKTPIYTLQFVQDKDRSEKRIPKHGDENHFTSNVIEWFPIVKKESPNMGTKTIHLAVSAREREVKKESPNMGTKTLCKKYLRCLSVS